MNAAILAAMEAYKPVIADRWGQSMKNLFEDIVAKHGPSLKGLSNCWTYAKVYRNTGLARFVVSSGGEIVRGVRTESVHALNESRLLEAGMEAATATVEMWVGKIAMKMGELENAEALYVSGTSFRITGTRGGHAVRIEQQMIINVSRLGRPFNQWPSRIYVDGKTVSEAAYKKMFKTDKAA
jgi:hypothetical protein